MHQKTTSSPGWVYNLADYQQIFALSEQDVSKKLLIYPGSISSVNAELHALGYSAMAVDPHYDLSSQEMHAWIKQLLKENSVSLRNNPAIQQAEIIIDEWQRNAEQFLADYPLGQQQGRYQSQLALQTQNEQPYEILLCADLSWNFELINELCRYAVEVRVFPLSSHNHQAAELGQIMLSFQQRNYGVEVRAVDFPKRCNGHAMLRIWAKECEVT